AELLRSHSGRIAGEDFYRECESRGLWIGAAFQRLSEIWLKKSERGQISFLGKIARPQGHPSSSKGVESSLLEACLIGLLSLAPGNKQAWLPSHLRRLELGRTSLPPCWAQGTIRSRQERSFTADLAILDESGAVLVAIQGITCREQRMSTEQAHPSWLYRSSWHTQPWLPPVNANSSEVVLLQDAARILVGTNAVAASGSSTPRDAVQVPQGAACVFAIQSDPSDPYAITACNRLREVCAAALAANCRSFVVVTLGAQRVRDADVVDPVQASLWGFARVIMTEHPELNCRLVDVPRSGPVPTFPREALSQSDSEEESAFRDGERYVHRIERMEEPSAARSSAPNDKSVNEHDLVPQSPSKATNAIHETSWGPPIRVDRTYLITGGLSGFGLTTAQWLVERGAQSIVLASRRGQADAHHAITIEQLSRSARITTMALDVTDTQSIDRVLKSIETNLPPLAGVFHAAMQLEDMPLAELTEESLTRTLQVKAAGAWELHARTLPLQLDYFVLFSSVAALVGNPHQASYAAANAYLNGLAEMRRAQGHAACSVNWGAIGDAGAVARDRATLKYVQSLGFEAMPAMEALASLEAAPADAPAVFAVANVDWRRWQSANPLTHWQRLERVSNTEAIPVAPTSTPGANLEFRTERELVAVASDRVAEIVVGILGLSRERLSMESPLRQHGLDSLMAVEIQSEIERYSGVSIPVMEILGGATTSSLVASIAKSLAERKAGRAELKTGSGLAMQGLAQDAAGPDLTKEFLERICVQPPYFDLHAIKLEGEWVHAVVDLLVTEGEPGLIDVGDAARHLAILGSCAASLRCPIPGKVYYPIARAHYRAIEPATPASHGRRFALKAKCTQFDSSASRAGAVAMLLDAQGQEIAQLDTDYHVIPEEQFHTLFAAYAQPTGKNRDSGYYTLKPSIPPVRYSGVGAVVRLPPIEPEACLGHFADYPAWPVSLMTRTALELVIAASRHALGAESVRVTVLSGTVTTHALVFAHHTATMVARPATRDLTSWICDIRSGGKLSARFEFETDVQLGDAAVSRPLASVVRVEPSRAAPARKRA
ncbi:MAG: SDR family NAD(P)-dependent oxidoreductase, partial [Myxococcales bacterium]